MRTLARVMPRLGNSARAAALEATAALAGSVLRCELGMDIRDGINDTGLYCAAQACIQRHLAFAALSPDFVAHQIGCSRAHLYRVFAEGPLLWTVLAHSGAVDPTKPRGQARQIVMVTGSDGYVAVLALGEISPALEGKQVILADRMDGRPLEAGISGSSCRTSNAQRARRRCRRGRHAGTPQGVNGAGHGERRATTPLPRRAGEVLFGADGRNPV